MSYTELKQAVRLSNDGDSWGTCFRWLFALAYKLEFDGPGAPGDWGFEPGALTTSENWRDDFDPFELETLDEATDEALERLGEVLWRWRSKLKAADLAY